MDINAYLEYRKAVSEIKNPNSLLYCFKWGLEYLDHQLSKDGLTFEFTDYSRLVLQDWKTHVTQLIQRSNFSNTDEIENLLDLNIEEYLCKPGKRKPCIFGVHYQLEDVIRTIRCKLNY